MWIPKRNLVDVSLTCKRFSRLVQDESLWTRMDVSNRRLGSGIMGRLLSRQVIILRLARAEVNKISNFNSILVENANVF